MMRLPVAEDGVRHRQHDRTEQTNDKATEKKPSKPWERQNEEEDKEKQDQTKRSLGSDTTHKQRRRFVQSESQSRPLQRLSCKLSLCVLKVDESPFVKCEWCWRLIHGSEASCMDP